MGDNFAVVKGTRGASCATLSVTGRGNKQFVANPAPVSGETKRDINRHLARADVLGEDLAAVGGTSLDKGVELGYMRKCLCALAHRESW